MFRWLLPFIPQFALSDKFIIDMSILYVYNEAVKHLIYIRKEYIHGIWKERRNCTQIF